MKIPTLKAKRNTEAQAPSEERRTETEQAPAADQNPSSLPADTCILIPVRGLVLFPGVVHPLTISRQASIAGAQEAARTEQPIGLVMQRDNEDETPAREGLYDVGTLAGILRYVTAQDGTHHIICQGMQRVRIQELLDGYPFLVARIERIDAEETEQPAAEIEARMRHLKERATEALNLLPQTPEDLINTVRSMDSPGTLADMVSSFMDIQPAEKQTVLELVDIQPRMDKVLELLNGRLQVLKLSREISDQTHEKISQRQREALLREQLQTIQKELGETDTQSVEAEELAKAVDNAGMPEEIEQHARKELKRLERMPEGAAEYSMARNYLEWLTELPWSTASQDAIDIANARAILETDHYGLAKIKRRILEYLAVRKLNPTGKSPILCFVGPPGVGKTSLGQSIARATEREFVRISLGGTHDEAEIRGHRRTYIGALPGNIIQAIRKAGTLNPVFMLDEMDKLGASFHGDPSSALLEVLDPEQNATFRDNYLGVPFDLSRVMFIGTANVLDAIPGPLRDRMEVIELPGYTEDEKLQIARRYLVERQLEANGLRAEQCEITDEALTRIIRDYTREAGCRNLERQIGTTFRHVAMQVAENSVERVTIEAGDLHESLGPRQYESEVAMRTSLPGVATGLAWTPVGGDILFVESSRVPGSGRLIMTGQLGDVMKESAQAALSLVKARAPDVDVDPALFEKSDIHVHVPAGAIPKDGPSAGVAMFISLISLLTGKKVRNDTAMTGEISLRGLVLPVGGIKEKVVAAVQAGIHTVLLPARNRKDLEEIPEHAREQIEFVWLERVDDAIAAAMDEARSGEQQTGEPAPATTE